MMVTDNLPIDPAAYVTFPEENFRIIFPLDIHVLFEQY